MLHPELTSGPQVLNAGTKVTFVHVVMDRYQDYPRRKGTNNYDELVVKHDT
jgi:hypothetical protein